jgi:hypothetical protein
MPTLNKQSYDRRSSASSEHRSTSSEDEQGPAARSDNPEAMQHWLDERGTDNR